MASKLQEERTKECPKCGQEVHEYVIKCDYCGQKLSVVALIREKRTEAAVKKAKVTIGLMWAFVALTLILLPFSSVKYVRLAVALCAFFFSFSLIRQPVKAAKINGWIVFIAMTSKFVLFVNEHGQKWLSKVYKLLF